MVFGMKQKVDDFVIRAMLKKAGIKSRCKSVITKKHEGVDGVVVALILIVVAVAAAILFRNTIMTTISDVLKTVDTKINALFNGNSSSIS